MRLGQWKFEDRPIFLAPMEDVSDPPFRLLCKRYGADLVFTEFISSGGLIHQAEDCLRKLDFHELERPVAIQIFGSDADHVARAAAIVEQADPDIIDINFGCPVRKVVRKQAGAGILRDLSKMGELVKTVIQNVSKPVTVKTRLGWDDRSIQILEVARMLEDVGIQALTVHARTRSQMYKGQARWEWLKRIKCESGLSIPLIGNGDAVSPQRIKAMFDETGVDAVMVGRGAIGNPWIFRDAKSYMRTGELPPRPSWEERVAVVLEHLELKCRWLGERKGVLEMRRMYGGYFKGFEKSARLRSLLMTKRTKEDVMEALLSFRATDAGKRVSVPALVSS
jgi:nifR3 family TIM-barrel protein